MPSDTRPARRMPSAARRAQLVEAAMAELAAGGYEALSLEGVATRAGVTRNLLYHYFPAGLHDVFVAAVERAGTVLTDGWATDPEVPLAERMAANFARMVEHASAPSDAWAVRRIAATSPDPAVRAVNASYERRVVEAVAENNLGTPDPPPLARAALEAYLAYGEWLLDAMRERGLPRDQVLRLLVAQLEATVAAVRRP